MGTPKTDQDYEHSEAALREKDGRSLIERMARWLDGSVEYRSTELIQEAVEELQALGMALHMTESSIAMAIATERQACVKECELVWMHTSGDAAKQCATAIRRRSRDELQEAERRDALGPWEDRA